MTVYTLMAECRYNAFKGVFSTLEAAKEFWREYCQLGAQEFSYTIYKSDMDSTTYETVHQYPAIPHKYYGDEWIPVDEAEYERIFNS